MKRLAPTHDHVTVMIMRSGRAIIMVMTMFMIMRAAVYDHAGDHVHDHRARVMIMSL
jgi:hypothetical protein